VAERGWPRCVARSGRLGAAPPLAQDTGHPATGTRRRCSAFLSLRPAPCQPPTLGPRASRASDGPRGQGVPAPAAQGGTAAPGGAATGGYLSRTPRKGSAQQALAYACPSLRRQAVRCMEGATPVWSQEPTKISGFSSGLRGKWPEDELCPTDQR
ncbi:mCG53603, partial [Mus musculus]